MAEFTRKMKKQGYTILGPDMAPIHFRLIRNLFAEYGYHLELLSGNSRACVDEGLKYVHNDTCYPALLVIGQMMEALHSGKYDLDRTALIMTQTGGGCRASNYIHLIRKALEKDGLSHVPVISLSTARLEKHSGFKLRLSMLRKALAILAYGDLLMLLVNQTRPYEIRKGESDALVDRWVEELNALFRRRKGYSRREQKKILPRIAREFAAIPLHKTPKVKVGIVGEIFVKYSPLGNNELEKFLAEQGCETMLPGIMGFFLASVDHQLDDWDLYGGSRLKRAIMKFARNYLCRIDRDLLRAVSETGAFCVPSPYLEMKERARGLIGFGCKMGEGWLLTAEMNELAELGYDNIVCAQPFGCLPNHVAGKGMIRKLKERYPASNIVPVDYDAGATKVNQENRIKLMLSVAAEKLNGKPAEAEETETFAEAAATEAPRAKEA